MKNNAKLLLVFLFLLSTVLPLSTDLFLPALPEISEYYGVPETKTNLTLIMFFVPFSLSMLILGPLSDKYGRRPVLILSSFSYCVGSLLCAIAPTMDFLIVSRILQAIGAGGGLVIATAIIKDVNSGKKQQETLALVQSISMVCPVVAPVIGALLISAFSWRATFWLLFAFAVAMLIGSFFYKETLTRPITEGIIYTLGRLGVVLSNLKFNLLLIIFAIPSFAFMAFLATASYIYQIDFQTNSMVFSYHYGMIALGMVIGPLIYIALCRKSKNLFLVLASCFAIQIIVCILLFIIGHTSPVVFTILMWPLCFVGDFVRPPGTFLMINLRKDDTGTASSLIGAVGFLAGAAGMAVAMLFDDYIFAVALLFLICSVVPFILWVTMFRDSNKYLNPAEEES